jgi:Tol biopolymer transport system component
MKLRILLLFVVTILIVAFLSGNIQQMAEQLFQSGIYKEEVEGELDKAIEIYEQILTDFPGNKAVAAKALYHIGLCYEKMGNHEAQKAYQRLIDEYPGQIQEVDLAKARLASLLKAVEAIPHEPTFRKIRIPTKITRGGDIRLAPDGKKISLASPPSGKLWIMPLLGKLGPDFPGEPVELNTEGVGVEWSAHNWSGDGKWIAFNEDVQGDEMQNREKKGNQGIYVVSSEGGKPKKIYENYRDARVINYRISLSPHGKTLAFSSVDIEKKEQHIYTIPVDGGEPKLLVDALAREPVFSPDGKMIAYVEDKDLGVSGGALWLVPAQGGTPKLVADAGKASSPIWSPEGAMIAYVDKQDKAAQIHIIPVGEDGETAGKKITIDAPEGIQAVDLLAGWTPDNKIGAVFEKPLEFGLYTVPAKGGKATVVSYGGYPVQPRFSPDGKRIFHFNNANEGNGSWQRLAISVVSSEGGHVKNLPLESDEKMYIPGWGGGNRVSPDGKMVVFAGKTPKDPGLHFHIWTLPVEGGKPIQLTESPDQCSDMFPCWSPDGSAVAFVRARLSKNYTEGFIETNLYIVKKAGGEPKPLTSESDNVAACPIAWSPDGKMIAFFSSKFEDSYHNGALKVISPEGGESRIIGKAQGIQVNKELAWSPDSKRIAFNTWLPTVAMDETGIKVMSLEDGNVVDIKTDLVDTSIYHLDWSPDGKKLVFGGYKGGGREFWLMEDFLPLVKRQK